MKKSKLIVLCLLAFLLILSGCGKDDPKPQTTLDNPEAVDELTTNIDLLPSKITLEHESLIKGYQREYNNLSDYDKTQIYNYDALEEAIKIIDNLISARDNVESIFDKVESEINKALVLDIDVSINDIDILKNYTDEEYNQLVVIVWDTTDAYILSTTGSVTHGINDQTVTLTAVMSAKGLNKERTLTYEIMVRKRTLKDISNRPVRVAYMSYEAYTLTEEQEQSLDIVNYAFSQIVKSTKNGVTTFSISAPGLVYRLTKPLHNAGIRVVLSLGGWQNDSSFWNTYREACSTTEYRTQVAEAIYECMKSNNLDGIDFDWEYPGSSDKTIFFELIKEVKRVFVAHGCEDYLITMAIPGGSWSALGYDYAKLDAYTDYYYVMTYDLDSSSVTMHHTALKTSNTSRPSIQSSVEYLLQNKVTPSKIVIGAAFYGRIYQGVSNTNNGLSQSYEKRSTISYTGIKEDYLSRLNTEVFEYYDSGANASYLYDTKNHIFITYDNEQSIIAKCNYVSENKLGGIMFWSFNNNPSGELLHAIYLAFGAH